MVVKSFEEERGGKEKKTNNQSESTQKFLLKAIPEAQGSSRGDILKTRNVISAKAKTFSMSQSNQDSHTYTPKLWAWDDKNHGPRWK